MQGCYSIFANGSPKVLGSFALVRNRRAKSVPAANAESRTVLTAHMRWALVLAFLRHFRAAKRSQPGQENMRSSSRDAEQNQTRVPDWIGTQGIGNLFSGREPRTDTARRDLTTHPEKLWQAYFTGNEPFIKSVYDCRPFYGLDAPHNLQKRFHAMSSTASPTSDRKPPGRAAAKYDHRIKAWSRYAIDLVEANGGWKRFSALPGLHKVRDIWPGSQPPSGHSEAVFADTRDSFVQRIIALDRDRYIQILTSPVGVLWPLWAWQDNDVQELLRGLVRSESDAGRSPNVRSLKIAIGPLLKASDLDVFVDINTSAGQMQGLPFPFGFAADAVQSLGAGGDIDHAPWTPELVDRVDTSLEAEYWSPPLLLGRRGTIHPRRERNRSITLMTIAHPCDVFASVYVRRTRKNRQSPVCYEIKSWAEEPAQTLRDKGRFSACYALHRSDMAGDFADSSDTRALDVNGNSFHPTDVDVVLSHFPADLLLGTNDAFKRFTEYELYNGWGEDAKHLRFILPSTVLDSGWALVRQPKMEKLLIDLGKAILKVEAVFRELAPPISKDYIEQLEALPLLATDADREQAAARLSERCKLVAERSLIVEAKLASPDALERALKRIGSRMGDALFAGKDRRQSPFKDHFNRWGWTRLLDYVRYAAVYFGGELFSRKGP